MLSLRQKDKAYMYDNLFPIWCYVLALAEQGLGFSLMATTAPLNLCVWILLNWTKLAMMPRCIDTRQTGHNPIAWSCTTVFQPNTGPFWYHIVSLPSVFDEPFPIQCLIGLPNIILLFQAELWFFVPNPAATQRFSSTTGIQIGSVVMSIPSPLR